MTVNLFIELISAFGLGFIACGQFLKYQSNKQNKKFQKGIEDIFIDVKKNLKKIKFKQRIQNYVHLKSGKYTIVYILDKKELAVFEKDACIAVSNQINSKVPEQLISFIETNFNDDIHKKIIQLGNYIVSDNLFKIQMCEMQFPNELGEVNYYQEPNLDLDTILDKINKSGMQSLSKEEQDYLNNLGK
jgi:hypothetical protein